jgi:hypothetical protein
LVKPERHCELFAKQSPSGRLILKMIKNELILLSESVEFIL